MKKAIFPGSFDPITKGHEDILRRIAPLFSHIYICIGNNSAKNSLFPIEKRLLWAEKVASQFPNVSVAVYDGLTVDFCRKLEANFIVRGIRNEADFRYEHDIAQANKTLQNDIETIFLATSPEFSYISSTIVRDIYKNNGDFRQFLPDIINE